MKGLKKLTQTKNFFQAIKSVWEAGLEAHENRSTVEELQKRQISREQEFLELSQLVHDYETRLHNLVRETEKYKKQTRELEWAYRALRRENQWLKEEIFKLKGKPLV